MSLAKALFGRMDEKESKNPLYYRHYERIDKENKELKRSLNTMRKMKDDKSTAGLLSKKDFVALEKGLAAYGILLHKRERASQENKNREAKKRRKEERGARWIRSSFEKVDIEFKLKIIYINSHRTLWNFYEDNIEDSFMRQLKDWGLHMETKEDTTKHVKELYKAMSDTTHPAYKKWEENVKNGLKEYKETVA